MNSKNTMKLPLALALLAMGTATFAAETGTPDAYLPFIESSGSEYIDTGVAAKSDTKAEIDFKFVSIPAANKAGGVLGAVNTGDTRVHPVHYYNGLTYGYGTVGAATACAAETRYTVVSVLEAGAQSLSTNGVQIAGGTSANVFDLGVNLFLCANNNNGTAVDFSSIRLYRCRIWQKDGNGDYQLVRDFRPCAKDYEACLYDEVDGKIYRSNGTDSFIGPLSWPDASGAAITNLTTAAYAQSGLAVNFDAFRNAGANAPRDTSATNWTDLVSGRTASLTRIAADPDQEGDPGCWTRDAFRFAGHTYFRFDEAFNLGSSFTIQLVCDVEGSGNATYPMAGNYGVFGAPNGLRFYKGKVSPVQYTADIYCGNSTYGRYYVGAGWNGKRATIVRDGTLMSRPTLFTEAWSVPATPLQGSLNSNDTPSKQWMIGNWDGSTGGALVGRVHAVRIYDHPLARKEYRRNWMVDNARFHGLVPPWNTVLVESFMPGAEGTEPCGAYAVSSSHTFTAPATATVGGNTYRCVGYTLERFSKNYGWNTIWTTPEDHAGETSFAFVHTDDADDGEAYNSARLTWRWELADGVEKIDAGLYSPLGMVANWDGIRNAGAAAAHDSEADIWCDASGNGLHATRFWPDASAATGAWTQVGYTFVGGDQFQTAALADLGPQFTWEIVTDASKTTADNRYVFGSGAAVNGFLVKSGQSSFYVNKKANSAFNWNGKYTTAMFNLKPQGWTCNATLPTFQTASGAAERTTGQYRWKIGGVGAEDSALIGSVLAVRLYDRLIPTPELVASRELDEVRFRGSVPATNAVFVATELPGAEGDQESGVYRVAGPSHAFTATARYKIGGSPYVAKGCKVEIWNSSSQTWTDAGVSAGPAWTTPAEASWQSRRITWRWGDDSGTVLFLR